ncbi:hypothetical protein PVL29_017215 [Vitis rotundifolia]|uniref:DNA-directed RNA polymerase n=1 Tax=Vitis rotundifolia TaxID=103349 RepID=A0AA38Z9V1_VITRO|nr:hypothetical protein PVL29_017215 [Vitis rotundifolia]
MELAKHFIRTNIELEWMVLLIIQIDGGKLMSSNINELYRRVIYRNNTLTDLLTTKAVDTLLDNGIHEQPMRDGHNKVYKSFSNVIEGKERRFCETLLGKWVDYSGRSVIVVGPSLSLHQCGLPREIAIELFQTFFIRGLIRQHLASNIGVAKIMRGHPVLLNGAPTLHRLGIQAFQPILVEGCAICLHPLVRKGFNGDFDEDQMVVHVLLSLEAQSEARLLMFSYMNLLSPAIGDPIFVPTQDMYNPCNRRNYQNERIDDNNYRYTKEKEPFFVIPMMQLELINIKELIYIVLYGSTPIEVHYESLGTYHEIYGHYLIVRSVKKEIPCMYIRTIVGHISLYQEIEEAIQGFCRACLYET